LLDNVGRIASDPENLSGKTAGPEVDCRYGKCSVVCKERSEDVIGTPPKKKEAAEKERCGQAVVKARDTVAPELRRRLTCCESP